MDEKQPQRLQSLSSRGGRGGARGGRGGRFMPKAVDRRSKEERESTAPAIKPSVPEPSEDHKQRGKFERKKPRQLGIRAEAQGPLAAPSIAGPSRSSASLRSSGPSITRGGGGARVKTETDPSIHMMANDERIDISAPQSGLFPLRLPVAPKTDTESEPQQARPPIVDLQDGNLLFMQLPDLGLEPSDAPVAAPTEVKVKNEEGVEDVSMAEADGAESNPGSFGKLGTLQVRASGKMTLLIGSVAYEVSAGADSTGSIEELVMLDEHHGTAKLLGKVKQRVLVMPDLDQLHI